MLVFKILKFINSENFDSDSHSVNSLIRKILIQTTSTVHAHSSKFIISASLLGATSQ